VVDLFNVGDGSSRVKRKVVGLKVLFVGRVELSEETMKQFEVSWQVARGTIAIRKVVKMVCI